MIIGIFVFLLTLRGSDCYPYTNKQDTLIFTSGVAQVRFSVFPLSTQTQIFPIPYTSAFTTVPGVFVSIYSISYQLGPSGIFNLPVSNSPQLTQVNVICYTAALELYSLRFSYIAVDFSVLPSFYFTSGIVNLVNANTEGTYDIYLGISLNDTTPFACFIDAMTAFILPNDLQVEIQCSISSSGNSVTADVLAPGTADGSAAGYRLVTVSLIVIIDDDSMNVICQQIVAENSVKSDPLDIVYSLPQDIFFIGLTSFHFSNRNLYASIITPEIQINDYTPFIKIVYTYLKIQFIQSDNSACLEYMATNVFSTYIWMTFNITNTSAVLTNQFKNNVSWLSSIGVEQPDVNHITYKAEFDPLPSIDDITKITYTFAGGWSKYKKQTSIRIIMIEVQKTDVVERTIELQVANARNVLTSTNTYKDIVQLQSATQNGNYGVFTFSYDTVTGANAFLNYYDEGSSEWGKMFFFIPNVLSFQSSTRNVSTEIRVTVFDSSLIYTPTKLAMYGTCMKNYVVGKDGDQLFFKQDYISDESPLTNTFEVHYKSDPNIPTDYQMVFKLVTLLYVRTIVNSTTSQLVFTNIKNPERYTTSHLSFNISGIITQSVSYSSSNLVFTVSYDQSVNDTGFTVTAKEPTTSYSIIVDDTKIIERFVEFTATQYYNNLTITLKNVESLTSSSLPQISFNISSVILQSVKISDDNQNIIISVGYNASIADQQLDIFFESDTTTVYQDIVSLSLEYDFPLFYCAGTFEDKTELYRVYASVLQYLYLIFCLYSAVCCNKLIAVETLFLIQLVYYSMIPVGIYCPPFIGIEGMKYVSGVNPLFSTLSQEKINSNFYNFGFKSNFLSNINLMLLLGFICPFIYGVMALASKYSQSYKLKPRLLKYGKSFLLEVPLTILFFNSFNIYISFAIEIQFLGTSDALSLVLSIIAAMLLPGFTLMFFFLNKHFCEFKEEFDPVQRIGSISQQCSLRIRQVYPAVLVFEYIAVPLFLSICSMFSTSLYAVIAVTTAVSVFILVSTPYIHKLDNIRLIIHRVIILAICGVCIGMKSMMNENYTEEGFVYSMPLILLVLLTLGILVNGTWICIVSLKWIRKNGIIDHKMKMKETSTMNKPAPINTHQGVYYPKLQYGQYRKENLINRKKNKDKQEKEKEQLLIQPTDITHYANLLKGNVE